MEIVVGLSVLYVSFLESLREKNVETSSTENSWKKSPSRAIRILQLNLASTLWARVRTVNDKIWGRNDGPEGCDLQQDLQQSPHYKEKWMKGSLSKADQDRLTCHLLQITLSRRKNCGIPDLARSEQPGSGTNPTGKLLLRWKTGRY